MSTIEGIFEDSLKEYKGNNAEKLLLNDFILKLEQELPGYFIDWMNSDLTGTAVIEPIAKISIEIDESAYAYTSLYNKKGSCMVSEGSSPNLHEWGLDELFEEDSKLVAQFLALCYEKVLPIACKSSEFLSLPRETKIGFSVGQHSGWECDELYEYNGKRYKVDYGNVRLKKLHKDTSCYTKPNTIEHEFMDHLKNIDIEKCANEFIPVFEEFMNWLLEQNPEPLDDITIAWSSNFEKEGVFGGCYEDEVYRWPKEFDFSVWFSNKRPKDLDHSEMSSVRYCVSSKIAEIACLASEKLVKLEVFKSLPKKDGFIMEIMNRTAGYPPKFYPF